MAKRELIFALALAIFIAFFLAQFASRSPDGLERAARDKGFLKNLKPPITSPLPDYVWPGTKNKKLAGSLAGLLGTLVVFGLGYSLAFLLKRPRRQ